MKKILVIAAHPDDETLGMGATIAKLTKNGDKVYLLIVTDGSTSQYAGNPMLEKIIADKKIETERAAKELGISEISYGMLPDMKLDTVAHIEINRVIGEAIDKYAPEIVYTHFWGDVNNDHREVYESTMVAVRPVADQTVREVYCYFVPSATNWSAKNGRDAFLPTVVENVTDTIDKKLNALGEYKTELRNYPHPRSLDYIRTTAQAAGLNVGFLYGEEFVLVRKLVD